MTNEPKLHHYDDKDKDLEREDQNEEREETEEQSEQDFGKYHSGL